MNVEEAQEWERASASFISDRRVISSIKNYKESKTPNQKIG